MIRTFNDPILHQVCEPVSEKYQPPADVIRDMESVLERFNNGVGLAAPQAGHAVRIIMLRPVVGEPIRTFVNPEIVAHGPTKSAKSEGCLSFPGVTAKVARWTFIRLRWFSSMEHRTVEENFHGWHARIIQHEIDHLNGICRVGDAWKAKQQRKVAVTC